MTTVVAVKEWRWFEGNLRKLREFHHLSQDALADKIQASSAQISLWESGNGRPNVANLCKLANALECSPAEFFVEVPKL